MVEDSEDRISKIGKVVIANAINKGNGFVLNEGHYYFRSMDYKTHLAEAIRSKLAEGEGFEPSIRLFNRITV